MGRVFSGVIAGGGVIVTPTPTPTPTPGLPQLTEALIATNQRMAISRSTIPTGKTRFVCKSRHYIDSFTAANSIRVAILNWYSVNETACLSNFTIDGLRLVIGGVVTDMLNGSTITVDGTAANASALIPIAIPAGTAISIWIEGIGVAGGEIAVGPQFLNSANNAPPTGGGWFYYPDGNQVAQNYAGDTIVQPTGAQTAGNSGIHIRITGEQADKTARTVFILGDSIIDFGLGSASLGWDTTSRRAGYCAAQVDTNMSDYVASPAKRKAIMKYANVLVAEPGTNDLRDLRTAAQLKADNETLFADFKSQTPGGGLIRTLLFPRCDNPQITAVTSVGTLVTATVPSTTGLVSGNNYGILNAPTGYTAAIASPVAITVISGTQFTYSVASTPANSAPTVGPSARISDNIVGRGIQRPIAGFGPGGTRDQFNTIVQTWLTGGVIGAIADVLTPSAASDDNHYWITDSATSGIGTGTSALRTADWIHESSANRAITKEIIKTAISNVGASV